MAATASAPRTAAPPERFFWNGVLILLPAAVLAGFALLALRQDRLLLKETAADSLRREAHQVLRETLSLALMEQLQAVAVEASKPGQRPDPDSPGRLRPDLAVGSLDQEGHLVDPAPLRRWQRPPSESGAGKPRELWEETRALVSERRFVAARQVLDRLLALSSVEKESPMGGPWKLHAARWWLELEARDTSDLPLSKDWEPLMETACREAVITHHQASWNWLEDLRRLEQRLRRIPGSPPESPGTFTPITTRWMARMLQDHVLREWAVQHPVPRPGAGIWMGPREVSWHWWVLPSREPDNARVVLISPERFLSLLQKLSSRMSWPDYVQASWRVVDLPSTETVIPETWLEFHAEPGSPLTGASLAFELVHPERLYAPQQKRARWYAGLVGLACLSVGAGFRNARSAFLRQHRLNEMKNNFVSSVSHELRTPLASIRLFAEELEQDPEPTREKAHEYASFIVQESRRLTNLVENILDYSRQAQGHRLLQPTLLDSREIADDTLKRFEPMAREAGIELTPPSQGLLPPSFADRDALEQILTNLLDNALKHAPRGKQVRLDVRESPEGVVWSVQDEGPGIAPEDRERIFIQFQRLGTEMTRSTKGVGLGLTIARQLAQDMGGHLWVQPAQPHGSEFMLRLPRPPKPSPNTAHG